MRLRGRCGRIRRFELQLDTKLFDRWKFRSQDRRRNPFTTELIDSLLAQGGRGSESHVGFPAGRSQFRAVSVGHMLFVRSAPSSARSSRGPRPLLFLHLSKRQSCADGDYIEDRMCWVGRQAQLVNLLPRSNADLRRIEVGALLGQVLASLFGTLRLFMREALTGSPDQFASLG
jgi:hypothetical protein